MEQAISQPFADGPEVSGTPGIGRDRVGPTRDGPAATDTPVIHTAEEGSATNGTTAGVLPLHADHLTTQMDTGEVLHQYIIRSVI